MKAKEEAEEDYYMQTCRNRVQHSPLRHARLIFKICATLQGSGPVVRSQTHCGHSTPFASICGLFCPSCECPPCIPISYIIHVTNLKMPRSPDYQPSRFACSSNGHFRQSVGASDRCPSLPFFFLWHGLGARKRIVGND